MLEQPIKNLNSHSLTAKETLDKLQTSKEGLTKAQVERRQTIYPPNELIGKEPPTLLEIFLSQFKDILVIILIFSAIISVIIHGDFQDASVIIIILIVNAFFGTRQEWKADKAILALQNMTAASCEIVRDGEIFEILTKELVPGDIIRVKPGVIIPADARVVEAVNLSAVEAPLTGESTEVRKFATNKHELDAPVADRQNMLFNGTHIPNGRGLAVVTETGMDTEFGKIATLVSDLENEQTPIQEKLGELGSQLGIITIIISIMVILIGVFIGGGAWDEMILLGVSLAVAAIPEGLPIVVTLSMAVGVTKMAKRNAIVRKLPAVESLGAASVICTDKTGTLTFGKMKVRRLAYFNEDGFASHSIDEIETVEEGTNIEQLVLSGGLCNNASIIEKDSEIIEVGDSTEVALLNLAIDKGYSYDTLHTKYLQRDELPFDSERKRMTTVHQKNPGEPKKEFLSYSKGAPDILLEMCVSYLSADGIKPITPEIHDKILEKLDSMADQALRVLAFAKKPMDKDMPVWNIMEMEQNLVFIGLMGLIDPPKKEVFDAVELCHKAGVSIKMVTGDHKRTAAAIGRELNISTSPDEVISGPELDLLSDTELENRVDELSIFARITPAHKLRIVQAVKRNGNIVAMTGDGVNDAPALKASDIGIAMGITGTDVTKETSDIILADDNFATIVNAIEEGRAVYQAMGKFLKYMLSSNSAEILVITLAIILNLPPPFVPIQILWINLVTDGLPALALGVDPPEKGLMERKPRDPKESIMSHNMIYFILRIGIYMTLLCLGLFLYELEYSFDGTYNMNPDVYTRASTITFATLSIIQLFNSYGARSIRASVLGKEFFRNRSLVYATLISASLQVFVIQGDQFISYITGNEFIFFTDIFSVVALGILDWLLIIVLSASIVFFEEIFKFFIRRSDD